MLNVVEWNRARLCICSTMFNMLNDIFSQFNLTMRRSQFDPSFAAQQMLNCVLLPLKFHHLILPRVEFFSFQQQHNTSC